MNELQVFTNPEFGQVRTVTIEEEPWFVGKDVAVPVPVNRVFSPTIKKSCLNPSGGGPDGKMGPV